jgi:hypothetical protein
MKEIIVNLWDFHKDGNWIVIPTNGEVNKDGLAVMGKGLALEAKNKFPRLTTELGVQISYFGNRLFAFDKFKIITFPTKYSWRDKSDICLIAVSASQLKDYVDESTNEWINEKVTFKTPVYLPRVGCGNGGLDWRHSS